MSLSPPEPRSAWALAAALAALPFLTHLPLDLDRGGVLVLLPALWLARRTSFWSCSDDRVSRALLIATAIAALISTLAASHFAASVTFLAGLVWIFAGALLARRLGENDAAVRVLLTSLAGTAAATCTAIWLTWREGTPMNAFPHYTHVRLFGLHMMLGAFAGFGALSCWPARSLGRRLAYAATIVACGGVLWSGGRTPIGGLLLGLAVWCGLARADERRRRLLTATAMLAAGLLLSALRWSPEPYLGWWGAFERSAASTTVHELTSSRSIFWNATWHSSLEAPWIGHGADSYRFLTPKQDGNQPHNWPLQLLHDFGWIGAVLASLLLARLSWRLLRHALSDNALDTPRHACAAAFIAALAAGLLDGVFYHLVLLLPTVVLAALAFPPARAALPSPACTRLGWSLLSLGALVLALHATLIVLLLKTPAPRTPDAPSAQLLRAWPSTTIGLERWLAAWQRTYPDDALEWTQWAARHSDHAAQYHAHAAAMLANRGEFDAALSQADAALRTAHPRSRPQLEPFIEEIRRAQHLRRSAPPERR